MFPALRFKTHDLPTQSILLFPVTLLYGCLGLFLMFPVGPKLLASTLGSHFQDRLPATALTKIKLKWDRMASLTVPRCRLWLCFEALGRITRLFFFSGGRSLQRHRQHRQDRTGDDHRRPFPERRHPGSSRRASPSLGASPQEADWKGHQASAGLGTYQFITSLFYQIILSLSRLKLWPQCSISSGTYHLFLWKNVCDC